MWCANTILNLICSDILLFVVLLMVMYTTVVYLPSHAMHIVNILWQ